MTSNKNKQQQQQQAAWKDSPMVSKFHVPPPPSTFHSEQGGVESEAQSEQQQTLEELLYVFYAKHDPSKTKKDIDVIAKYGRNRGIPALNAKLREKYGADLNS